MTTDTLLRAPAVHRRGEALVGAAALAAVLATVRAVDPRVPGHYPSCPFHALTGLHCPGCGSLRALADLVHGDLPGALDHNALLVLFLPVALVAFGRALAGRASVRRTWEVPAVALVLLLWTVLRNLGVAPFSVLAP
jgi:hypothetical protein